MTGAASEKRRNNPPQAGKKKGTMATTATRTDDKVNVYVDGKSYLKAAFKDRESAIRFAADVEAGDAETLAAVEMMRKHVIGNK